MPEYRNIHAPQLFVDYIMWNILCQYGTTKGRTRGYTLKDLAVCKLKLVRLMGPWMLGVSLESRIPVRDL